MQDVTHHKDIRLRQRIGEEVARAELHLTSESLCGDIRLEVRTHCRKIEADTAEMLVAACNHAGQCPLGSADIRKGRVLLPGKAAGDSGSRAKAYACHGFQEPNEALR